MSDPINNVSLKRFEHSLFAQYVYKSSNFLIQTQISPKKLGAPERKHQFQP